ncbi:MAG: DUF2975 domain-containing protein [Candidatus Krumholzibacteria bacterium]|nr:DUF2975 domain-containing protein [Candidatus Krumholzibacteria bacterium]
MRVSNLSSLTVLAKVVIYIAFGASLLVILSSVGSFIYMMSNADDLSKVVATEMYELPAIARDLDGNVWQSENGEIKFRLHKLYGEFSYLNMSKTLVLVIFFRILVLCALFFVGVVQMVNIFEDVSQRKPFARENAGRLRIVGYAMAGGAIFKFVMQMGTFLLFKNEITMSGAETPWLWLLRETFNWGLLAGGLVVLVISEVFRLGNKLQEEQELTV